ncbi:MAG: hypothetical protein IKP68_01105 [Clostridia bacterium]|nr:hypothetical protein [Clostridia bacterium]
MFRLIAGATIEDISGLKEEYQVNENKLRANVSAEKIPQVFISFLKKMREDEPLFLFIEAPCKEEDELRINSSQTENDEYIKKYHKDVYYLDGWDRENLLELFQSVVGELLVNDGFVCFGMGSLESHIELGKYEYNVLAGYLYGNEGKFLTDIFDDLGISHVPEIITAWDLISDENTGTRRIIKNNGKDIYTLIDQLKELGLYKAETREEDSGAIV